MGERGEPISMPRLTTTQVRVLEFIERWCDRRGRPPSVREITRGLGLKSSSSAQYQLRALEQRGVIARWQARERRIRIVRRSNQLTDPLQELEGELSRQVVAALRQLVNAALSLQSREHLTRAELHYVKHAVALGIAVIQKLDGLNAAGAPSRDGADREPAL